MKRLPVMILALLPAASWALLPGDATRGKTVHDAKCIQCHVSKYGGDGSGIYTRADHKVKTVEGLMKQIGICNEMTKAGLDENQENDLVKYLAEQHYKFK
jgi:cytochrome c2